MIIKKKLDSLYEVMDQKLNIIGFEDHFKDDARSGLNLLKQSYVLDQSASELMCSASYGVNYRAYRIDEMLLNELSK